MAHYCHLVAVSTIFLSLCEAHPGCLLGKKANKKSLCDRATGTSWCLTESWAPWTRSGCSCLCLSLPWPGLSHLLSGKQVGGVERGSAA